MANVHTFNGSNRLRQLIGLAAQGSLNTNWINPFASSGSNGDADRAVFVIWVGTLSDDVDAKVTQAQDATGTGAKDITGAVWTTFTTTEDERFRSVEIGPGALDDANGFSFVRVEVTVASGTPVYGVFQINHRLRYPGIGGQDATYDEQVIVLG